MGAAVTLSHADIDPKSIEVPSFSHADIDAGSIEHAAPSKAPDHPGIMSAIGDAASSAGKTALGGIAQLGRGIERYAGAPIRTMIGAAQDGEQDPAAYALSKYGQDPELAPTGKDIAAKAGLSKTENIHLGAGALDHFLGPVSLAGLAGTAIDAATDPLMYIPGGEVADAAKAGASKVVGAARKLGGELSGVADKEIEAYAMRTDKVKNIIDRAQDEGKFQSQIAANHMRDNINNDVARTTGHLNSQISSTLKAAPKDKVFPSAPIKQSLQSSIDELHPQYQSEQISKIKDVISKINEAAPSGLMSAQDLQSTKNYLYDATKGAWKDGHEFFGVGTDVTNATRNAGAVTKQMLDQAPGLGAIKNANRQLEQLHEIEEALGSSILDKNKQAGSLYSIGAGSNPKDELALKHLGQLTGQDYLQGVTDMSAARTFSSPSVLNGIKTGRSLLAGRVGGAVGGTGGAFFGGIPGAFVGAKLGETAGLALSSPTALKAAIDLGQISGRAMDIVGSQFGINPQNISAMAKLFDKPEAQQLLMRAVAEENQQPASKFSTNIKTKSSLSK